VAPATKPLPLTVTVVPPVIGPPTGLIEVTWTPLGLQPASWAHNHQAAPAF